MNQRIPNPDCRDGKHTICDGHGWDVDADTAVRCPCVCHPGTQGQAWEDDLLGAYPTQAQWEGIVCTGYTEQGTRTPCTCTACTQDTQHRQHAVPASEHKACTCGARKTRDHCTCKHRMQDTSDYYCI